MARSLALVSSDGHLVDLSPNGGSIASAAPPSLDPEVGTFQGLRVLSSTIHERTGSLNTRSM